MKKKRKLKKLIKLGCILVLFIFIVKIGANVLVTNASTRSLRANHISLWNLPSEYKKVFTSLKDKYKDKRIDDMIQKYHDYPISLLELLNKNEDTFDFVYQYPNNKNKRPGFLKKEELKNGIPALYQWDDRWGYSIYGEDILALTGCAPTSLAMILSYFKQDTTIDPPSISKYAEENGLYVEGQGTQWAIFEQVASLYDIYAKKIAITSRSIKNSLNLKHPIILRMGPGKFTDTGHFIVLCAFYSDGTIKIHDPNSKTRTDKHWNIESLLAQSTSAWEFYN